MRSSPVPVRGRKRTVDFRLVSDRNLRANVSAYDAVYVALAEALDTPLLTRDRRLANAPGHGARVEMA